MQLTQCYIFFICDNVFGIRIILYERNASFGSHLLPWLEISCKV